LPPLRPTLSGSPPFDQTHPAGRPWPRHQERHIELYVACLGLLVSVVFYVLDFPCDSVVDVGGLTALKAAQQLPEWLSFFRVTCMGFHVGVLGFVFLPSRGMQLMSMHVAMLWNSLSYWLVASSWCLDDRTWFGLLVLQHAFQVIGTLMIFDVRWLPFHVGFTIPGAFSILAPSHASEHARRLADTESNSWGSEVLVLVFLLVGGMIALALLTEMRQRLLAIFQNLLQKLRGHAVAGPPKAAAPHRGHCQCCRRVRTAPVSTVQEQAFDPVVLNNATRAARVQSNQSGVLSAHGAASTVSRMSGTMSSIHASEVPTTHSTQAESTLSDLDGIADIEGFASQSSSVFASQGSSLFASKGICLSQSRGVLSNVEEKGKQNLCQSAISNLDAAVEESCKTANNCDLSQSMNTDPKESSDATSECGMPESCEPTEASSRMEGECDTCTQSTSDSTEDISRAGTQSTLDPASDCLGAESRRHTSELGALTSTQSGLDLVQDCSKTENN